VSLLVLLLVDVQSQEEEVKQQTDEDVRQLLAELLLSAYGYHLLLEEGHYGYGGHGLFGGFGYLFGHGYHGYQNHEYEYYRQNIWLRNNKRK
jgi:hypothetical protein